MNPYTADQIIQLTRDRNVRWFVVKRRPQIFAPLLSFEPQLIGLLRRDFEPAASLDDYDVYRRKQGQDPHTGASFQTVQ